jgi:uncharacterized protein YjbJ (UPF0337 family)
MNEDILKSQWKQIRPQIKVWWSVLTDEDLDKINGQRDKLIGMLQQKYAFTKEEATRRARRSPGPTEQRHWLADFAGTFECGKCEDQPILACVYR